MDPHLSGSEITLAILGALGGLAIFLLGMQLLTEGVQAIAQPTARVGLRKLTRHPILGFLEGTTAATLIHSGPVVVTAVAFTNAGIITFPQSASVILGANLGTTLSMQLVALDISYLMWISLLVGFVLRTFTKPKGWRALGTSFLGLGMLFLGLRLMKLSFAPFLESGMASDLLTSVNTQTGVGFALKTLAGFSLAALFQSSGAVIALVFSLVGDGGFTRLDQVLPVLLGAHMGGAMISFWASVGASVEGRRAARIHLAYNLFSSVLALALSPAYFELARMSSDVLLRQVANLNTMVHLAGTLSLLPFSSALCRWVERKLPQPDVQITKSYLEYAYLRSPERAIVAAARELKREGDVTKRMLENSLDALVTLKEDQIRVVMRDEDVVDTIAEQLKSYLHKVAERQMPLREAIFLQQLRTSADEIERIGDHIKGISYLTSDKVRRQIWFSDTSMIALLRLGRRVLEMLRMTVASLEPGSPQSTENAKEALRIRRIYKDEVDHLRGEFESGRLAEAHNPLAGLHYLEYLRIFDRLVRHMRFLAREEVGAHLKTRRTPAIKIAPLAPALAGPPAGFRRDASFKEFMDRMDEEERQAAEAKKQSEARESGT